MSEESKAAGCDSKGDPENKPFLRVGGKDVEGAYVPTSPVIVASQLPDSHPAKRQALAYIKLSETAHGAGGSTCKAAHDAGALTCETAHDAGVLTCMSARAGLA